MLGLQHAGQDLAQQGMPDLAILATDERDVEVVSRPAAPNELLGTTHACMTAPEDDNSPWAPTLTLPRSRGREISRAAHRRKARLRAALAAKYPQRPCTPPVGGVEEEQR